MPEIVVIGAGISGLTAAYQLAKAGRDVLVLESEDNVGGKIQTERIDGYLLEAGPNSLRIENHETLDLIEALGLSNRIVETNPASKKRFILKNGNWVKMPSGLKESITTSLFSLGGKLRVLAEPFISKSKSEDESAASFITRRLGSEVFDYAADPFITGIYAGDPAKLSMLHAFPQIWRAEQEFGSLLSGMIRGRKKNPERIKSRVISFPEGISELTNALRSHIPTQRSAKVLGIDRSQNGYDISTLSQSIECKKIILALPAYDLAPMIEPIAPELSYSLVEIEYPPVAVAYLGYRKNQFQTIPEGFGVLIPSKEHRDILGIIFSSSNFPNRAPEEHLLFTILMGGAKHSDIIEWPETRVLDTAISEVRNLLKPAGTPYFQHLRLWKQAIPQYNLGYGTMLDAIEATENDNPGLHFIGNYRGGISIGSCIKNATELANKLV